MLNRGVYEAIGFQNGNRPQSDIREGTGMLPLLCFHHFLDRIQKVYEVSYERQQFFKNQQGNRKKDKKIINVIRNAIN